MRTTCRAIAALLLVIAVSCDTRETIPVRPPSVATGIKADCVICAGHTFDVMSDTPTAEFGGQKYYFCSRECEAEFSRDAAKAVAEYTKKKEAAATQPATAPVH